MYLRKFLLTGLPHRSHAKRFLQGLSKELTSLKCSLLCKKCLICVACKSLQRGWKLQAGVGPLCSGKDWAHGAATEGSADPGPLMVQDCSPRRGKWGACDFWQRKDGSALPSGRLWGDLTAAPRLSRCQSQVLHCTWPPSLEVAGPKGLKPGAAWSDPGAVLLSAGWRRSLPRFCRQPQRYPTDFLSTPKCYSAMPQLWKWKMSLHLVLLSGKSALFTLFSVLEPVCSAGQDVVISIEVLWRISF